jgi:HlyD family secretion protein
MKKTTGFTLGVGVVLAVAATAWALAPRPIEVEVAQVTTGRFEATIDEDGKTRLRDRYVVSAPLAGQLARIALREGDPVDADTVVATLMPALPAMTDERTLREQQLRVEVAEAQVRRVNARVEGAQVALAQATNELRRSEQLAGDGFVSPTKLDTDRLAVQAAKKDLDAAREERHVAGHELEQAAAALMAVRAGAGARDRAFAVRAPIAGRVLRVVQPSETTVGLGAPLVEIGDTRALEVVAELLTTDALQATPGTRVRIERWGGDGLLDGRVRLVEPSAFTKVSALGVEEQRVKVLIDITSPSARWAALGDGFRVGVRIVTTEVANAVKVPVSAVFPTPQGDAGHSGGMAAFVLDQGHARLVAIRVGERNATEASIRDGLAPGASVIVYPPPGVKDGSRVKARAV